MRKIFVLLLLVIGMALSISGQNSSSSAVLAWTPNPTNELVSGYRIEYMKLPVVTNWTFITFSSGTNATIFWSPGWVHLYVSGIRCQWYRGWH